MNHIILYEYGRYEEVQNTDALLQSLQYIWSERLFIVPFQNKELVAGEPKKQPFLKFENNTVKARNYVGFVQTEYDLIEIYPKVFRNAGVSKENMLRHIFFWLGYCKKRNLPFSKAQLGEQDIDKLPELFIYLIARQFWEAVSNEPLTMYQAHEEALQTPRGTINFKRYINQSVSYGNFQDIECDYEPFLFDNTVNRVIKYCSRLLMSQTNYEATVNMLQEITFILDEVEDMPFSSHDLENIKLNTFFENYNRILDSCKKILNQQLYSNNSYELNQWSLLFPMEYIFEDFVAGFITEHFSEDWKVEHQKSEKFLAKNLAGDKVFQMQHDIFLTHRVTKKTVIIDTKYKMRENYESDVKTRGIAQADMYQMLSYAYRRNCKNVLLIYPNRLDTEITTSDDFCILNSCEQEKEDAIKITAMEIPFWTEGMLVEKSLEEELFNVLECQLKNI